MSDPEYNYDSDDQVSSNHSKLVDSVRQLDKRPSFQKAPLDNLALAIQYAGSAVEEDYNVEKVTKKSKKNEKELDPKVKSLNDLSTKQKVVPKPLEKPVANKIKRTVGFEETKKELTRWTGIIARNRTAASVSFPLSQASMKLENSSEFTKRFRLQSELEKKLAELEPEKEPEVEEDTFNLTYQESLERRKEAAKLRAQQSYNAAKARRQNKIKSKKFHRIQKKERLKKTLKEFEELQKNDPQAALEKLEELDKARAHERMTLRHKSTGQWAKNKQIRAKYDKESRQVLAEQLSISKELTQKVKKDDESEDEEEVYNQPIKPISSDKENPWINGVKTEPEIDDFISGYRKFWEEKNKKIKLDEDIKNKIDKKEKIFEEPKDFEVTEENEEKNNTSTSDDCKVNNENSSASKKVMKNLQKTSKNKLGIKSLNGKVTKIKKAKIKAGTSSWSVSPVNEIDQLVDSDKVKIKTKNNKKPSAFKSKEINSNNLDLDEMFDSAQDKIQEKINKKLSKVKKMLDQVTKKEKKKRKSNRKNEDELIKDVHKLGLKGQQNIRPVIDEANEESTSSRLDNESKSDGPAVNVVDFNIQTPSKTKTTEIDPTKFINMKPKHVTTMLPNEIAVDGALDDSEAEEDQYQIISEAFADDDVVDEFRKEKEDEIKKSQPEDIDLTLPGWGSWGGKNIKTSIRKKRRFILKFPKEEKRRDENKGDVVIIEEKCPKIKKHLVSELPFPFTSVQDYEASIRAPIGRDFVPEKTFSKFVQPAVKTKMGKIIEPMSEEVLVKNNSSKRKKITKKEKATNKSIKGNNANDKNNQLKKKKTNQSNLVLKI